MALQCQLSLNYTSYTAGQNPPPMLTLTVYNPNASAVNVTGMEIYAHAWFDVRSNHMAFLPGLPPLGPGMTTLVPATSTITIGPMPMVFGTAANVNSFAAVNQAGNLNPINPQGSQPAQVTARIKATVYGSDGSVNIAGDVGLLISYSSAPPLAYQGGFFNFSAPNNFVAMSLMGVL